jgi:hypothetical protein
MPSFKPGLVAKIVCHETRKAWPECGQLVPRMRLIVWVTLSLQVSRTDDQKNEAFRDKSYAIKLVTDVIDTHFATKYLNTCGVLCNADIDSHFVNSMMI